MRGFSRLNLEHTLLLACARSTLQPRHLQQIESAVPQGVNWNVLWSLARAHGVGYFVGHHLLRSPLGMRNGECGMRNPGKPSSNGSSAFRIPHSAIQQDLWQETAHALILRDQQQQLNAELMRSGIKTIWLKGLILSERLYNQFEARHCGDLDLLVAPGELGKVQDLLARLGFQPHHPESPGKEFHPMAAHHAVWAKHILPNWRLMLEVHDRLSGPAACQPTVVELFARSQIVSFLGQPFRVPSFEDELLILCLHAHHHNYALLRCLMDVAEFVRRFHDKIDWPLLVGQARAARCLGRLRAGLEITHSLVGLESSKTILAQVPSLTSRQRLALRSVGAGALLDPRTQQDDLCQAKLALLMDRWADTFRLLAPRLFPKSEHVQDLCPASWRRWPGLPRAYFYLHAARQALRQ
jgi:hypothetical protein